MGFFNFSWGKAGANAVTLADDSKQLKKRGGFLETKITAITRTRTDIKKWNDAQNLFRAEDPKTYPLQLILEDVLLDARLSSQISNRDDLLFSMNWSLKNASGEIDKEQTLLLSEGVFEGITKPILDADYLIYSLIQLRLIDGIDGKKDLHIESLPRTNVVPQLGKFFTDYTDEKFILYRELKEYGTWILEFNGEGLGLINKAVPHVLMKRFAQSCWSELCEIYGIPPMFLKTDTSNSTLLARAKKMLTDLGAGAKFVIDNNEELKFAEGITTTGDVYKKLINLCDDENSLLISGAIIGQDTVNGNRSKDESAREVLLTRVKSNMKRVTNEWNKKVIPALVKIGFLKPGLRFEFDPVEDLGELWTRTKDSMDNFEVDPEWITEKFGVKILGKKEKSTLTIGPDFFA